MYLYPGTFTLLMVIFVIKEYAHGPLAYCIEINKIFVPFKERVFFQWRC